MARWDFNAEKPGAFPQEKTDTTYPRASLSSCLGNCWPQPAHTAPTGLVWCFAGVVSLPGPQNRTQGHTGPSLGSPFFLGALLPRQDCQVPLQLVVYCLLDRPDGKLQCTISHLASLSPHLSGFYVDELLLLQLTNVLGYGVSAHPGVLAYASDAGPALVGFPVFAVNQVGVDRRLTWAKAQCENGVGQKKKSSFIQPFRVCVSDFRAATSIMVFKKFTPIFQPMSIEKSKFTVCSQYNCASVFHNRFREVLFFVYCSVNFEVAQSSF